MKTKYRTSKAPYERIHIGDIVQRYEGSEYSKVVIRWFGIGLKPDNDNAFRMLKVDKIIYHV